MPFNGNYPINGQSVSAMTQTWIPGNIPPFTSRPGVWITKDGVETFSGGQDTLSLSGMTRLSVAGGLLFRSDIGDLKDVRVSVTVVVHGLEMMLDDFLWQTGEMTFRENYVITGERVKLSLVTSAAQEAGIEFTSHIHLVSL